jgi:hypothetical protein
VAALALSLVTAPVSAQYGPQPSQGVTVSGVIAVPADSLRFQLLLHVAPGTSSWEFPVNRFAGTGGEEQSYGT